MTEMEFVVSLFAEKDCDHEGHVHRGCCEKCGERDLESDSETYGREAP